MDCYKEYSTVFSELEALLKKDRPVMVSIDGRCGSGKTYLASMIKTRFDCNVFHIDDYYLPLSERPENWEQIPAGNIDFKRFKNEVISPLLAGKAVDYRPFCCKAGEYSETVACLPKKLTVIEGSYSQHLILSDAYDLKIFLSCTETVQKRRLLAREGEHFSEFENRWIPMEERYFAEFCIDFNSDLYIETSNIF